MIPEPNLEDIQYELSQVVSYNVYDVEAGTLFATYFAYRVMNMKGIDEDVRSAFEDMFTWLDAGNEARAEDKQKMRNFGARGAEFKGDLVGYIEE